MGRTNKLVDGCYSFWQGGLFPLLQRLWPEYLAQTKIPGMVFDNSQQMYQQQSSTLDAEHSGHALLVLVTARPHLLQLLYLCIGGMRSIAQSSHPSAVKESSGGMCRTACV